MSSKDKFSEIANDKSRIYLPKMVRVAFNQRRYFEASLIQYVLLEVWLRIYLLLLLGKHGVNNRDQYWDKQYTRFSDMINYVELLGAPSKIISKLRALNKLRNKIIHQTYSYKGKREINIDAAKLLNLGLNTETILKESIDELVKLASEHDSK